MARVQDRPRRTDARSATDPDQPRSAVVPTADHLVPPPPETAAGDDDQERQRRAWFSEASEGLDLPKGYSAPTAAYEMRRDSVRTLLGRSTGEIIAGGLVLPVKVFVDPDGQESIELAWRRGDRWIRKIVPRSVAASGAQLVTQLADLGLPVISSNARAFERFLAAVERLNRKVIPRESLARRLGWQPDDTFLTGPGCGVTIEPAHPPYQAELLAAHHSRGTLGGWQNAVQRLAEFPVAAMIVSAAFAAPLLRVLDLKSFMLDIWSRSTRGKTTTGGAAASVWGKPTDDGLIANWQTTPYALEGRLGLMNGLPLVVDETQLVKSPEIIHKVIYALGTERTTPRKSGYLSALPFQTILFTTGERSALTFTSEQGAAPRVLSISRPPIPAGGGSGEFAVALTEGTQANYGHAGPAFIERLTAEVGTEDAAAGAQRLRDAHAEILAELLGLLDTTADFPRRRAPRLAALILAGRLAHEWGILPFPAAEVKQWAEVFQAEVETDDRAEMALELVRAELGAHPETIAGSPAAKSWAPPSGWLGRLVQIAGREYVALLPDRVGRILRDGGYELAAVRVQWLDQGVIKPFADGGRQRDTQKYRLGQSAPRMFVFEADHLVLDHDDA